VIRQLVETTARGASLVVTNRRWGVTMSAAALGFGLFAGVAIGPGASGTFATGAQQVIALPPLTANTSEAESGGAGGSSEPLATTPSPSLSEEEPAPLEALPSAAPFVPAAASPPPAEEPAGEAPPPAGEGEEEDPELETTALAGTVVHANPAAGSYALAIKGGELVPVHARELPKPGAKLSVEALRLANGTFAEAGGPERKGRAAQATFRGVVTHLDADPLAPAYTLSGRGASLLVSVPPDQSGALPPLPALGAYATATATLAGDGALTQAEIELEPGEPATYLDLAGIYAGQDPASGQLLLSSDDARAGEADLSLVVPPEIDPAKLKPGDSYLATAQLEADGSLKLTGLASDEHRKGADDAGSAQGDLKR